jgi:DNA-binding NarL/FixJ family response regulator
MSSIKIIAADDHRIFLEGLKSLFELTPTIQLLDVAEDGDSLLELIDKHQPDIALIDLSMPGADTETIIKKVEECYPKTRLLALTMHMNPEIAIDLFGLGLAGYVLKECAFDELENAILQLMQGEQYISPELLKAINGFNLNTQKKVILTAKESDVMLLIVNAKTNKEIAQTLNISERTVRFHLSNCFVKFNVNNRQKAANKAIELGLLSI